MAAVASLLAFPPVGWAICAHLALIPWLAAFTKDEYHFGFGKGLIYGLILNLGLLYWLALNQGTVWYWATLSMISAVLFLALNYGLIGLLYGWIGRRNPRLAPWTLPLIWTAVEYLRSFGALGFTWNQLANTQIAVWPLIQYASLTGGYGVTLWIVLINVVLYALLRQAGGLVRLRLTVGLVLLVGLPLLHGGFTLWRAGRKESPRTVTVGIVQPNVDPRDKWTWQAYGDVMQLLQTLTDSVATPVTDLVVWPETATPTYLRRNHRHALDRIRAQLQRLNVHLLTGVPDYEFIDDEIYRVYNATFLLRPDQPEIEDYRKIRLVPFGEYIPLSGYLPQLKGLNLGQGNFDAGRDVRVYRIPLKTQSGDVANQSLRLGSLICYESSFPALTRRMAIAGAELLVVVSNDAWFGHTSGPFLHAEIARLRAIENRTPVVRSANTGISMAIDAYGRVVAQSRFGKLAVLNATLVAAAQPSFYTRHGDWLAQLAVILLAGLLIWIKINPRKTHVC